MLFVRNLSLGKVVIVWIQEMDLLQYLWGTAGFLLEWEKNEKSLFLPRYNDEIKEGLPVKQWRLLARIHLQGRMQMHHYLVLRTINGRQLQRSGEWQVRKG